MSAGARETARDIFRFWGLPPVRGAFAVLVEELEAAGRVEPRRRYRIGGDAAIEDLSAIGLEGFRIIVWSRLKGRARLLAIAHELAEDWLRCEHHDCVESDCDAVARELVSPTWVPGVQLELALGA